LKIVNINNVEAKEVSKDLPLFLGGSVTLQPILEEDHIGEKVQVAMVKFAPGARTKLHTHSTEQILIVTEGEGIVATKDEENVVTSGMIAYVSPEEAHWHGATKDSSFAHLSILGQPHEMKIVEK
jgi:quercetin dioxygenase-like cupin family protein